MLRLLHVVWFTFIQAACSTLLALLIGLSAAFFCGRRKFAGRKFLLSLSSVPFCVPPLIIALGYVTFLGLNGGLNHFLMSVFGLEKPPVKILYSFAGLVIAHGFYNFPIIMKNVSDVWERLPSETAESARLLGASEARVFRTVTVFQLIPSIVSSSMLVFIYCFLSFILVLLFGGIGNTTLEVEIYKSARGTLDFHNVAYLAITETFILCAMTLLYSLIERNASRVKKLDTACLNERKAVKGFAETAGFILLFLLIFVFFLLPLAGIVFNAFTSLKTGSKFTLETFRQILKTKSFLPSLKSSIIVGTCTGILCTVLGFLYAVVLRFSENKNEKPNIILKIVPMLPMSISSVVVGVLITLIIRRGTPASLVLAQSFLSWPLAFRIIYPFVEKIPDETLDCAALISRNRFDTLIRLILPVCSTGILNAFCFSFALSAGDTTLPLVLAIPKFDTLSLFCYRFAGAYRFNEACAAGVILGVLCAVFFALSSFNFKLKNKRG
ncbi:MAG: iron ABC transporter permease [Spirochaetaceae bacterium]|nr:iron ABC transporter permease [Spirochaetaceae bacterium]